MKSTLKMALSPFSKLVFQLGDLAAIGRGRLLEISPLSVRFRGVYETHDAAMKAIPRNRLAGYDNAELSELNFDEMCRLSLWDYPVLYWLGTLLETESVVVDAGGHMGTKFRAFQPYLALRPPLRWIVYDVPAIVAQGRLRAEEEGLRAIEFADDPKATPPCDILLASGLLQFLDIPFPELVGRLPACPQHIICNKVAVRDGSTIYTLEDLGDAMVPYQIRSRETFLDEVQQLGYEIVDQWTIPSLSHVIPTHPHYGPSESIGMYLRRSGSPAIPDPDR